MSKGTTVYEFKQQIVEEARVQGIDFDFHADRCVCAYNEHYSIEIDSIHSQILGAGCRERERERENLADAVNIHEMFTSG